MEASLSANGSVLVNQLLQVAPVDDGDVVVAQGLLQLRAGDRIEVALAPGGAERVVLPHDGARFGVVMSQVNDHVGESGLAFLDGVQEEAEPLRRRHTRVDQATAVKNDR